LPERVKERQELEKDWHETYDTEPVDERDFEMKPEALAADFDGEVIVEGKGDLAIHGGKLVSAKAGQRDPRKVSDKELSIDEKTSLSIARGRKKRKKTFASRQGKKKST
jgi:hypothetical protein